VSVSVAPPPRAPARKANPQRRRRLFVVVLALAVLLTAAWGVSKSPLLAVDHVRVRGVQHLTAPEIEDAARVHTGDAMVWIDTGNAVAGIEALPYVASATLTREWPHTVRIVVRERRPAAWVAGPSSKALVDGTGRVLETVDQPPSGMPELLGAHVVPPPGGRVDALDAAKVAGALHGIAAAGTKSVETTDHGVVLHLLSGVEIRMGEPNDIDVKVRAALAVLGASAGAPVSYVDVSVPTNPVRG
jgi:cell division protein FtsQ